MTKAEKEALISFLVKLGLTAILFTLKLTGICKMKWIFVFTPFWFPALIIAIIVAVSIIVAAVQEFIIDKD